MLASRIVIEYGLDRSATRFELSRHVEIARTCLQQVGNQVCDLNSVMEFGVKYFLSYRSVLISLSRVQDFVFILSWLFAFSALTLSVGSQEEKAVKGCVSVSLYVSADCKFGWLASIVYHC